MNKVSSKFQIKPELSLIEIGKKDGIYVWVKNNGRETEIVFVQDGVLYEKPNHYNEWRPVDRPLNFSPNMKRFVNTDGIENYIEQLKETIELLNKTKVKK